MAPGGRHLRWWVLTWGAGGWRRAGAAAVVEAGAGRWLAMKAGAQGSRASMPGAAKQCCRERLRGCGPCGWLLDQVGCGCGKHGRVISEESKANVARVAEQAADNACPVAVVLIQPNLGPTDGTAVALGDME